MHKVEELKIWRKSIELAKSVYQLTSELPSNEKYGLISQVSYLGASPRGIRWKQIFNFEASLGVLYPLAVPIKRSVISISSNIAEGAGRNSGKEFKHFLSIANGSAYELQTQLILAIELNLIPEEKVRPNIELVTEIQKMNYSLQKNIQKKISILNTNT